MSRYVYYILAICFTIAVFNSGFLAGVFWQRSRPVRIPLPFENDLVTDAQKSVDPADLDGTKWSDEERRMAEALKDPDFKRVYDYLMREHAVKFDIPTRPLVETDKTKPEPMSERTPIRFSLSESAE